MVLSASGKSVRSIGWIMRDEWGLFPSKTAWESRIVAMVCLDLGYLEIASKQVG